MFSTLKTASLLEMNSRIADVLYATEFSDLDAKIGKILHYPQDMRFGKDMTFSRVREQAAKDIFTLFIMSNEEFLLVSPSGMTLRASNLFFERLDVPDDHKIRVAYEKVSHGSHWLFLEYPTMLLTVKNWDRFGREMLIGTGCVDDDWVSAVAERIRPFEGWSPCVPISFLPEEVSDLVKIVDFGKAYSSRKPSLPRGRKPTGARDEYFRRYPDEKPQDRTYEAIAAELKEAGFPISSRQVQTYESERNKE